MKTRTNQIQNPTDAPPLRQGMRQTFIDVFHKLQEHPEYSLLAYATKDPDAFYKMAIRLIPAELKEQVSETDATPKKTRAFVRLSDGTEIDF